MGKHHEVTLQTKQNFIDAFWGLYCEKRIAKITVKEITTKAGYNRSTFYEYFKDAYDVLEHLEQSLIPTLELLPPLNTPLGNLGMSMDLFMKLYEQNAKYYSILLGEKGDPAFASKLKKAIHSMLVSELAVHKSMDTNKLDFILEYTLTSMIGLMGYWFNKNGPMPKEQLYDLIRQLMEEGVVKQLQQNMKEKTSTKSMKEVIQAAMALPKCRVCGCMKKSLETVKSELSKIKGPEVTELLNVLESAIEKMEPIQYT